MRQTAAPTGSSAFGGYAKFYDLFYRDKNYALEAEYVLDLLKRHGLSGSELLELGCGTCGHAREFVGRGYRVVGVERSQEMLCHVPQVTGLKCVQGNIQDIQLERTFDAVLALFHVISYLVDDDCLQSTFERAHEHLDEGGLFLFDVWYGPAVLTIRPEVRVSRLTDARYKLTRIAEPELLLERDTVDVNYEIFAEDVRENRVEILRERHSLRYFSLPELRLRAECAGFELLAAEEFLTGRAPSDRTWGVAVVLRRN